MAPLDRIRTRVARYETLPAATMGVGAPALILLAWAVSLLLPNNTLAAGSSFRIMVELAPDWCWALVFLWLFAARVYAVIWHRWWRAYTSLWIALSYAAVGGLHLGGNPYSLAGLAYLGIAYGSIWLFMRERME